MPLGNTYGRTFGWCHQCFAEPCRESAASGSWYSVTTTSWAPYTFHQWSPSTSKLPSRPFPRTSPGKFYWHLHVVRFHWHFTYYSIDLFYSLLGKCTSSYSWRYSTFTTRIVSWFIINSRWGPSKVRERKYVLIYLLLIDSFVCYIF